jgi:beta-phosphoglucomutase family hydrolase
MSGRGPVVTLSPRDYDAVLFDLDGVLTRTADLHAAAWKQLFDDYLEARSEETGEEFVEFDINGDYRRYVDGKPRYDGVRSFLASRGLELPFDAEKEGQPSVRSLGEQKDKYFRERLERQPVEVLPGVVELLRSLRDQDLLTAVVSSSKNCGPVLEAAGLDYLFDVRVDGNDIDRLGLEGKPAPDMFLEAARELDVETTRTVVVEDAIAGVKAGRAGGFGLVIGVDRSGELQALHDAGADVVVADMSQVCVAAESPSGWSLVYENFDPLSEGKREALCAVGNGYVETRGAFCWAHDDEIHYPGTYLAGGYNRLQTEIAGRTVENEDLVNFPNWLSLEFRMAGGEWFDLRAVRILEYRQELHLRRGLLLRTIRFEDRAGRCSTLRECRFASMEDMHLGAVELTLTAENWAGAVTVRSAIDGRVVNAGVDVYRHFNNRHLEPLGGEEVDAYTVLLVTRTRQSQIRMAQAVRTTAFVDGKSVAAERSTVHEPGYIGQQFDVDLGEGDTLRLEKTVCIFTSRDHAVSECTIAARKNIRRAPRFGLLLSDHVLAWKHMWRRFDIHLRPSGRRFPLNVPMLLRLNMLHLLQAVSHNSIGLDIGVPARGWTGETYRGHIFWDELFIFPFLNYRTPEITRSLLMYRYRRLPEARAAAARAGLKGAMFPWQSGSDGQEETQELNLNPRSARWVPDNSWLQRHVGSAVAWNVWQYFQVTDDVEFLHFYGAELILEIARFWASIAHHNPARGRYEIHGVMGPDEFHDGYPDAPKPGLRNNAYTNVMAAWVLRRALDVLEQVSDIRRAELTASLRISADDIERWEEISRQMFVPFHEDGIISQFEGYEDLIELDWEAYRMRYGNIQRLDLILEAEGDSANRYKLSKQPDVLMLFYLFSPEELCGLLGKLGCAFAPGDIARNVAYYDRRSSHGSTLSRVVHAWVLARTDRPRAMTYFTEALQSDVEDIQQGTTAEGVHLGAMAGTVDLVQRVSTGIEVSDDVLRFNPELPSEVERLDMRIRYRGHSLDLRLKQDTLTVRGHYTPAGPIRLACRGEEHEFTGGSTRVFQLAP